VLLACALGLAGFALWTVPALAATIEVNTATDENGTGSACSLREAIFSANGNSDYGNHVTGNNGGAINSGVGALNLINSTVTNNTAFAGGDISINTGSFSITNTTISENTVPNTGGGIRDYTAVSTSVSPTYHGPGRLARRA
jgi:CSLREA domain-containing protein